MKIQITAESKIFLSRDVYVSLCFEDTFSSLPLCEGLDKASTDWILRVAQEEHFQAKKNQSLLLRLPDGTASRRILLLGAGQSSQFRATELRTAMARAVRLAQGIYCKSLGFYVQNARAVLKHSAVQFLAEGAFIGGYVFGKYLTGKQKKESSVDTVCIYLDNGIDVTEAQAQIVRGQIIATAINQSRDWVNESAGVMTPSRMADVASELVSKNSQLTIQVLSQKECQDMGMGLFLAVAQGSVLEPTFIHISYVPSKRESTTKKVALVGKGITFDSGGLVLKTPEGMMTMKGDMSGGATMIATMGVLAQLGCPHEVHALIPCAENMTSGSAFRQGDILVSLNGRTVEINNTDAEGRLILADAFAYAHRTIKPDEIIDYATLTGASMIALGPYIAGVMGNHQPLTERFLKAAEQSGEDMWQLPLSERLKDLLQSDVADSRNTGPHRYGGAIVAALFIQQFTEGVPWVHVDLAGPSFLEKEVGAFGKGATGFGLFTLIDYLSSQN